MPPSSRKADTPRQTRRINSIVDFAKYLDLSVWTVSRALNGHPEVKESTRRRVHAAMEEVGYRPNPLARGLGRGRTGLIGVCALGLDNPILTAKIYHLQDFLRRHGFRVVLEMSFQNDGNETRALEDFLSMRVDGVVLMYSGLSTKEVTGALQGLPCVQVDPLQVQEMASVSIDRQRAMRLLFEHLLRHGHRSFGLLFEKWDPWRWPALVQAAAAHRLDAEKIFRFVEIERTEDPIAMGQIMTETALNWPSRPTALIARDDRVALGAIQALRQAGIEVPRHMSVTGFDNLNLARRLHPTLTTIDQNPQQLMQRVGEMLLRMIQSETPVQQVDVDAVNPELIGGESTGPAWVS